MEDLLYPLIDRIEIYSLIFFSLAYSMEGKKGEGQIEYPEGEGEICFLISYFVISPICSVPQETRLLSDSS